MRIYFKSILFYFLLALTATTVAVSQTIHQKGYYMFPIKPGTQSFLSGTMGELRSNHFHAGIDIKTAGRSLPVYAAASGYVSRVVVMTKGYGTLVTLKHPNGQSTLYAHLEKYEPKLAQYVKQKQTQQETFEIELNDIPPNMFSYNKGDVIAYSGNSGSSGGPHLHFEIRDEKNNFLNPLLFGFSEIKDNVAPEIMKVAMRTFGTNSRVNGEFGRVEFKLKKVSPGNYEVNMPVYVRGTVGLEIVSYDFMNGPKNYQGINVIDLSQDGQNIFNYTLERLSRDQSININAHIDYELSQRQNTYFQKCYVADGNFMEAYKSTNSGKITISDSNAHQLKVVVADAYNNVCTLTINLTGGLPLEPVSSYSYTKKVKAPFEYKVFDNSLKIVYRGKDKADNVTAILKTAEKEFQLPCSYYRNGEAVYLWDLNQGIPDSLLLCDIKKSFDDLDYMVLPNTVQTIKTPDIDVHFPKASLFDTLYLKIGKNKDMWDVHDFSVPFASEVFITLKNVPPVPDPDRTAVYSKSGATIRYAGGIWHGNDIDFRSKYPGHFVVATDTKAPVIKVVRKKRDRLEFKISDYPAGIQDYDCYMNGQWTLMYYDYKRARLWSEKLDKTIPFKGEMVLKVTDNVGNVATYKTFIK